MFIHFYGGARLVTGANYLIETGQAKVLVDCGMFQGGAEERQKNEEPFPYNPSSVDYLFITHAHIDHTGRIPKLWKDGFRGKIITTKATADFTKILLLDSAGLIEGQKREEGEMPIYTEEDVLEAIKLFESYDYGEKIDLPKGVSFRLRDAGHILGSCIIELWIEEPVRNPMVALGDHRVSIVFSGDLGNSPMPLLKDREFIEQADYVLVESTYGDRIHENIDERKNAIEDAIEETVTRGGVLMIPSFAIERTQELLFEINSLIEYSRIPKIPVFLDSPLAIKATEVYKKYLPVRKAGSFKEMISFTEVFEFANLKFTKTVEQSKAINEVPPPKVIIAGSGMSTGGRILHHEKRYLSDPKSLLLIIGYQAKGTLGRIILDGAEEIKIFGEHIPVRANVKAIGGYSAHADQKALLNWLGKFKKPIKKVFVVQGEEKPANVLAQKIKDNLGIAAIVPLLGDVVELV